MIKLLWRANRDQYLRKRLIFFTKNFGLSSPQVRKIERKIFKSDINNTNFIKKYLTINEFPSNSQSGKRLTDAAWLLVLHSSDIELMQAVLEVMQASPKGEYDPYHIALLTDRINISLGQPQIFGTQFDQDLNLFPIFEPEKLDDRRLSLGIESFENYFVGAQKLYG